MTLKIKLVSFFFFVFLSGCISISTPTTENVISTQTALPSVTFNPTIDSTQLIISEPTVQTTSTVLQPTWTSQPTLSGSDALYAIDAMIETNGGCQLPCWWKITPGETSWENALILLSKYSPEVRSNEPNTFSWDDNRYFNSFSNYVFFETPNSEIRRGAIIIVLDDIVSRIIIGNESTGNVFDIPNLLAVYGEPTNVIIDTINNTPTGILPFQVVMFYPNHHFVAVFEFTGNKIDEMIKMCYKPSTPNIYIWSPVEDKYIEVSGFSRLVPGDWAFSKDLEVSTSLNVEMFYQEFVNPTPASCIETSSDLW